MIKEKLLKIKKYKMRVTYVFLTYKKVPILTVFFGFLEEFLNGYTIHKAKNFEKIYDSHSSTLHELINYLSNYLSNTSFRQALKAFELFFPDM